MSMPHPESRYRATTKRRLVRLSLRATLRIRSISGEFRSYSVRARSAARAICSSHAAPFVKGCAPPSTRLAIRSVSSNVDTASRRSSSVALGSLRTSHVLARLLRTASMGSSDAPSYRNLEANHRLIGMVEDTLCCALTEQLDWSLDDFELSASEKVSLEFFSEHRLHRP